MPLSKCFRRAADRLQQVCLYLCCVIRMVHWVKLILIVSKILLVLSTGDSWVIAPEEYSTLAKASASINHFHMTPEAQFN